MMASADVPQYHELLWPALQTVAELGGSASIGEIVETVIKREGFTDASTAPFYGFLALLQPTTAFSSQDQVK